MVERTIEGKAIALPVCCSMISTLNVPSPL
jgi:hypothetical protein